MMNSFRLSSKEYLREEPCEEPKSVYFMAVEGNTTEIDYFTLVNRYSKEIGINSIIRIEILHRRIDDTNSAPEQVLKLVEECIKLRENKDEIFIQQIITSLKLDTCKYNEDFIRNYINESSMLDMKVKADFENFLENNRYDLAYYSYLRKIKTLDEQNDKYCIVIDRDYHNHSEDQIKSCIKHCADKNFRLLLSTPCFEFWLLLHLQDADMIRRIDDKKLFENRHVSKQHTIVSKEVSDIAGHNKSISEQTFQLYYLKNIKKAITNSKEFATDKLQLLNLVGTNIGEFMEEIIK